MSPKSKAKSESSTSYVLTGRSASLTLGLPDSDDTVTLVRGEPTEVPAAFTDQVEAHEDVYSEGDVPDDAITGLPPALPPGDEEPADEPAPAAATSEPGETAQIQQEPGQSGETTETPPPE